MILTSVRSSSTWVVHHMVQSCASRRACAPMFYPSQQPCGTPDQTSLKETSSGNTRKQLWDFLASEAGAVMEEGVLPLAFVRGHRPKEKSRGSVTSFKILTHLGGSDQTLPGSMGMKKTNPAQHFDRGKEVSQPQVREAERALEIIAQARDSTPDSEVCVMIFFLTSFQFI